MENNVGNHLMSVLFMNCVSLFIFERHLLFELYALFESHLFQ